MFNRKWHFLYNIARYILPCFLFLFVSYSRYGLAIFMDYPGIFDWFFVLSLWNAFSFIQLNNLILELQIKVGYLAYMIDGGN